ncbi:MAG: hypothetical protein CME59_21895 [Halioglobus sp.]|nr:hypothetical protein [Halioglobus sp.]
MRGNLGWSAANSKIDHHSNIAAALGPDAPDVIWAWCLRHLFVDWNWAGLREALQHGFSVTRSNSNFWHGLATYHFLEERIEEAMAAQLKGLELDPFTVENLYYLGATYFWHYSLEEARSVNDRVLQGAPEHRGAQELRGWILAFEERYDEALLAFEQLSPGIEYPNHRLSCLGYVLAMKGDHARALACREQLELVVKADRSHNSAVTYAVLNTALGDFDTAFHYLELAVTHKIGTVRHCTGNRLLAPLRDDPRLDRIRQLIGPVPAYGETPEYSREPTAGRQGLRDSHPPPSGMR